MKKIVKRSYFLIFLLGIVMVSCEKNNPQPDSNITYTNPDIAIDSVVNLNNTSVRVYVNVLSIGGGDLLESVWGHYNFVGQNSNLYINLNSVSRSVGTSYFDIAGLQPGSNYVVNLNASNAGFKTDSDSAFFSSLPPVIGQSFNGGKCAYILQPGDLGYDPSAVHGFLVAWKNNSQVIASNVTKWGGCQGTLIGCNQTAIGTGGQNHSQIYGCALNSGTAWRYVNDHNGGTLSNPSGWFLPSTGELLKISENRAQIGIVSGGATSAMNYWSSTESDANQAMVVNLVLGSQYPQDKDAPVNQINVLGIRYF